MDISRAALPAMQPPVPVTALTHPLYPIYREHRNGCIRLLVEASTFEDWLAGYERDLRDAESRRHPQYPAFMAWMQKQQGGARRCPAGNFPHNFNFWLNGGRW